MLNRVLEAIVAALMAATVVIAFAAVFFRYVIGQALGWSFEALLALLVYMTFIGAYLALRRGAHLKIDVIVRMLPLRAQAGMFLLNQLVIAAVGMMMLIWGTQQAVRFAARHTVVMELPLWPLYGLIPLCGLAFFIEALSRIPGGLRRARQGLPPESEDQGFSLERRDTGL
jgi:TRAP-type C4-dicarboxylate transport system permease small subunit